MAVITISRQVGSGGDEVARRLCQELDYRYFDKRLMVEAAADVGLSPHEVVDFTEDRYQVRSFLERLFRAGSRPIERVTIRERDAAGRESITERALDEEACIDLVRHTIDKAYESGDIVIAGRGGQAVLQDRPGVLHVRLIASREARIRHLQQMGRSGIAEIKTEMDRRDRGAEAYLKRFYDIYWDDPLLYDLVLRTDHLALDTVVSLIVEAAHAIETEPVV